MEMILAASAIKWTPVTFYVASGIVNTILVLFAFRALQVDVENNSFIGAAIAVGAFTAVNYFFRDAGVVGAMVGGASIFFMLVFVTSGEALKSLLVTMAVFAVYGAFGSFIVDRTPLSVDDIAGLSRVVMTGGLEAEPITEDDNAALNEAGLEDDEYEYE